MPSLIRPVGQKAAHNQGQGRHIAGPFSRLGQVAIRVTATEAQSTFTDESVSDAPRFYLIEAVKP